LRALRAFLANARHAARRRAALAAVSAAPRPRSILVLCQGNLCRSPFAAALLRRQLEHADSALPVVSAGYFKPNLPPPPDAIAAAAARGIDLADHRSQTVSLGLLDAADLVVIMNPDHAHAVRARRARAERRIVVLGDLDPLPIVAREIADPYGRGRAVFDDCYARIDRCVAQLLRALPDRPS
jgi:protein-tyrosine-phosphatase